MVKMIITDLDRSLLDNERRITAYSKDVFQKCVEKGIVVVFATARPLRATRIFYDSILPRAVICHNGAVVYVHEKKIYQCGIESRVAAELLKTIMKKYPLINLAVEANDEIFSNFDPGIYWKDIISKELDVENLPRGNLDKIIIGLELIDDVNEAAKLLPGGLYIETSEGEVGLIMNRGATKWNGIKELLKYFGIKEENTIAFGDDYNDIEMIEKCGTGIAMANGIDEIKSRAKYICGCNNRDGVAKWIEENVL